MPMSEDVASAAVSMAGKTVSGSVDMTAKVLDALLRLLREMNEVAAKRAERKDAKKQQKQHSKGVVQKDLMQSLKMKGRVSLPDLRKHAVQTGDQIVYSDQGLSKDDVSVISKNAKAMGIPVAFSRAADKTTYYPCVSSADSQMFKNMLQSMIANKLNADRQKPESEREFCQRAVAKWELPFISQECQRLDIQGSFAPHPTERNQVIFIYRKMDEDPALSILDQIDHSCKELKDVRITADSEGFVTVKDEQTGRTYSFDASNTSEEVMLNELQDQLGFDSMKARLTAAKFESECLTPEQIEDFKQDDPHNAFYAFGELYIPEPETGRESPVTEPYKMGYYVCKYDNKLAFSISNPQGQTVLFTADKISYKEVQKKLTQDLGIKDKALLVALTDKVVQCSRSLAKENMKTEVSFSRSDFNMSDPLVASGMRRTAPDGKVFVKKQPLETLSLQIARTGKNSFSVTSTAQSIEFDEAGNENTAYNTRELDLPLHDSQKAYEGIKKALVSQGVPLETAKNVAKETVTKAQSQPDKETVYIEQMTTTSVVCFTNMRKAEIPVRNGTIKPEDVKEALGISDATAQDVSGVVVLPNGLQLNTSYVFTDPKGEIRKATEKMYRAAGYKVKIFNLIDMAHSNNYDPFEYVYGEKGEVKPEKVYMMTKILFNAMKAEGEKDDFWSKKGEQVLQAVILLLYEQSEYDLPLLEDGTPDYSKRDHSKLNYTSVADTLLLLHYPPKGSKQPDGFFLEKREGESDEAFQKRLDDSFLCPLDKQFMELQKRKPDTQAYKTYCEIRNAPEETGQSFLSTANVKTFPFNFPAVKDLTCCDNIHLETIGDEKTVLYIITSATSSTFDFLSTMMYSQLFDTLADRANFKYDGHLKVHVRFIMDEFANLGEIPNFEKVITFVRSMGISIVIILQMLTQLKTRYEKSYETITGACSTQIFLGGAEESTIKSISERLGKETIDIRGRNRTLGGRNRSTSENNSIVGRELMQPNEIATMPSSDCLVMISGLPSFYNTKYYLEGHPNYKFLGLADPKWNAKEPDMVTVTLAEYQAQQKEQKQAAKAATEKHASIKQTDEQEQSENVEKQLTSAFKLVDLLSILRYPPKLKIEEKYADAPKNEDVYGDPLALPVDFDPDLLYPDVRRKESIANASDAPPVKESIDFQPFAAPASEIIKDPIISLSKQPVVEPTAEATEPEPVKKVATSSNFETAEPDNTTSEPDETAVELIGDPVSEAPSPENQSIPVDNPIVDLKPESSESDLTDPDENDTSFLEDLYGI